MQMHLPGVVCTAKKKLLLTCVRMPAFFIAHSKGFLVSAFCSCACIEAVTQLAGFRASEVWIFASGSSFQVAQPSSLTS